MVSDSQCFDRVFSTISSLVFDEGEADHATDSLPHAIHLRIKRIVLKRKLTACRITHIIWFVTCQLWRVLLLRFQPFFVAPLTCWLSSFSLSVSVFLRLFELSTVVRWENLSLMEIAPFNSIVFTIYLWSSFFFARLFCFLGFSGSRIVCTTWSRIIFRVKVGIFAALFVLGQKVLTQTFFSFLRREHGFQLADSLSHFGLIWRVVK